MKKLVSVLLCLAPLAALAEWIQVPWQGDRSIYGESRVFVDQASIRRSGNIAKLTWLQDMGESNFTKLKGRVGVRYLSKTMYAEYDCSNGRYQLSAMTLHSGSEGSGQVFENNTVRPEWRELKNAYPVWRATADVACRK